VIRNVLYFPVDTFPLIPLLVGDVVGVFVAEVVAELVALLAADVLIGVVGELVGWLVAEVARLFSTSLTSSQPIPHAHRRQSTLLQQPWKRRVRYRPKFTPPLFTCIAKSHIGHKSHSHIIMRMILRTMQR
jgi:hypothetical protein